MSALTPERAALLGRIGAYRLHATHDPRETTARARASFLARFEREVDPEGILPEAERVRRAEYARKAHFTRLAMKSAETRAKRRPVTRTPDVTASAPTSEQDQAAA